MTQDCLNTWYTNGIYHVRYDGVIRRFTDYLSAKTYVDTIMQSAWFSGYGVNDNKEYMRRV